MRRLPGHGSTGAPCAQRKRRDEVPLALLGWEAQHKSLAVLPAQGNVTAVQRIPDPAAMLAVGWPRRNAARHRRHHDVRSWRDQSNLPGRRRPGRSRLGGRGVLGGRVDAHGAGVWRSLGERAACPHPRLKSLHAAQPMPARVDSRRQHAAIAPDRMPAGHAPLGLHGLRYAFLAPPVATERDWTGVARREAALKPAPASRHELMVAVAAGAACPLARRLCPARRNARRRQASLEAERQGSSRHFIT